MSPKNCGVPLAPFGEATQKALNALPDADHTRMEQLGLVIPMEYNAGDGDEDRLDPDLDACVDLQLGGGFPRRQDCEVVHAYKPSDGGTVADDVSRAARRTGRTGAPSYKQKYCTDDSFIKTREEVAAGSGEPYVAPTPRAGCPSLVDRCQLERPDPRVPPDHRQGHVRRTWCRSAGTARSARPARPRSRCTPTDSCRRRTTSSKFCCWSRRGGQGGGNMSVSIRPRHPLDAGLIARFINGSGGLREAAHEVKASEAEILRDLFGASPKVFCESPNGTASRWVCLWFYSYSTFQGRHGIWLEDLYVDPIARGKGIGKALLIELARRCVREGLGAPGVVGARLEAPSIEFYRSQGAIFRMTGPDAGSMARRSGGWVAHDVPGGHDCGSGGKRRDRGGRQDSLAYSRRYGLFPPHDDGKTHHHGAPDIRKHRQAIAGPDQHRGQPAARLPAGRGMVISELTAAIEHGAALPPRTALPR